ncbi:MAG: Gfo/Idh/MocA family oxidoreductase [bacterium]
MTRKAELNVAVIGVGNMGKHHARVYSELPNVRLAAVVDSNARIGKAIANKFKCNYYRNFIQLLKKEKLNAVSIAVPTSLHKKLAIACINEGIAVLIEKPIADSVKSAHEIINSGKKHRVPVCVGHIERFNPVIQKLKKYITSGKFGKIISISSKRVGLFPSQIQDTDVIIDLAVHDIDICNYLLGMKATTVNARAGKALNSKRFDYADILLGYNGIDVNIQVNWITPVKVRELALTGTKGYAELNYLTQTIRIYKSRYRTKFDSYGDYIVNFSKPDTEELNLAGEEPLKLEIESFIEHLRNNKKNVVSAPEGLDALTIALRAIRSAERNQSKI